MCVASISLENNAWSFDDPDLKVLSQQQYQQRHQQQAHQQFIAQNRA